MHVCMYVRMLCMYANIVRTFERSGSVITISYNTVYSSPCDHVWLQYEGQCSLLEYPGSSQMTS